MKTSLRNPVRAWRYLLAGVGLLATSLSSMAQHPGEAAAQYCYLASPETEAFLHHYDEAAEPEQAGQNGAQGPQQGPQQEEASNAVPAAEKSRKLSRTYAAANKPYSLDTRYGRVQINTWSRNEVRTDVEIITRADTDEKAQQLLDMIQVQMTDADATTGGIVFRSKFGAMPGNAGAAPSSTR
ncbi:hypothetical protein [Hymenobacter cellulosilyticus]|uniref:Uncharacterized protein n=1 Tax=Hymenobacter cellulosilyticus TaxID=2932248 RepID=A0A8T9Q3Y6_9BACT|nr:hypothetical protein [Hymenobacter cellulosilyticus]UOQ72436.1 hypothetical protein MUN79_28515 [Hymenobacter cellulosilyticus]